MRISGMERREIAIAGIACLVKVAAAPSERLITQRLQQHIRHLARMAAIAVGEWMDRHQPMMETCSDLIGRVCLVLNLSLDIVTQHAHALRDLGPVGADVLATRTILTGP